MSLYDSLVNALVRSDIDFSRGEILAGHCTFRIGGPADLFLRPRSESELCDAIRLCRQAAVPCYVLGNGSNILFSDAGFRGAVISTSGLESALALEDRVLTASAGCTLLQLCRYAQKNGLTGLEFAYGIPGTVGGAVYMNAGAYDGEIRNVLQDAVVLDCGGTVRTMTAAELEFSYRHSILEDCGACVLQARFQLVHGDKARIAEKMDELMNRRREKQPLDKPSAGSTFKRPQGAFAAALIDRCGLRGYRVGGAAVSEKHCGFVVNVGGATCADVLQLCRNVSEKVRAQTGYVLEKEIRVVGQTTGEES